MMIVEFFLRWLLFCSFSYLVFLLYSQLVYFRFSCFLPSWVWKALDCAVTWFCDTHQHEKKWPANRVFFHIIPNSPIPSHSIRGSFSNEGSQMGDWRGEVCQRLTLPAKNLLHRSNIFLSILHLPSVLQLNCNLFSNQPRISKILLLGQKGTIHEFRNPSWFLLANANIYICLYSRTSLLLHRSNLYIIEWMHCLGNGNLFVGESFWGSTSPPALAISPPTTLVETRSPIEEKMHIASASSPSYPRYTYQSALCWNFELNLSIFWISIKRPW